MKYMELHPRICQELHLTPQESSGVNAAMSWMDMNPGQVPGQTITRSDYQKLMDDTSIPYGVGFTDGFHQAGGSIIWEPTNAELIIGLMGEAPANLNRRDLAVWLDKAGVRVVTESE